MFFRVSIFPHNRTITKHDSPWPSSALTPQVHVSASCSETQSPTTHVGLEEEVEATDGTLSDAPVISMFLRSLVFGTISATTPNERLPGSRNDKRQQPSIVLTAPLCTDPARTRCCPTGLLPRYALCQRAKTTPNTYTHQRAKTLISR